MRKNLIAKAAPGGFVLVSVDYGCGLSALRKYGSRQRIGKEMNTKYKENPAGGLALSPVLC